MAQNYNAVQRWAYAFPSGTATVGFDTAAQVGIVHLKDCEAQINLAFFESGTVTTGYSFDVEVSHDRTNWVMKDTDVDAEEVVSISDGPWTYVRVTAETWVGGTGDVVVTVGW